VPSSTGAACTPGLARRSHDISCVCHGTGNDVLLQSAKLNGAHVRSGLGAYNKLYDLTILSSYIYNLADRLIKTNMIVYMP
jgi:hypothetical protein